MGHASSPEQGTQEATLLRAARAGDMQAFSALYRMHARSLYSLALRLSGDPQTAEDLTHDAFLKAMRMLASLRPGQPMRPWLNKVVANAFIDQIRKQRRLVLMDDVDAGCSVQPLNEEHAETDALLRRLPAVARTVLWLHEVEGWSHKELAARFRQSESWSKSMLSRALARLRQELEQEQDR